MTDKNTDVFSFIEGTMKDVIKKQNEIIEDGVAEEHELELYKNQVKAVHQINRAFLNAAMVDIARGRYGVKFKFLGDDVEESELPSGARKMELGR
jgi:hypothetical protein